MHTRLGTLGYIAPELLGLLPHTQTKKTYTNAVDMWALGCIVHEILTLQTPFLGSISTPGTVSSGLTQGTRSSGAVSTAKFLGADPDRPADINALYDFCSGKNEFPIDMLELSRVSNHGIEFVKGLLIANPGSRLSAKEALQSPWLLEADDEINGEDEVNKQVKPTKCESDTGSDTKETTASPVGPPEDLAPKEETPLEQVIPAATDIEKATPSERSESQRLETLILLRDSDEHPPNESAEQSSQQPPPEPIYLKRPFFVDFGVPFKPPPEPAPGTEVTLRDNPSSSTEPAEPRQNPTRIPRTDSRARSVTDKVIGLLVIAINFGTTYTGVPPAICTF